MVQMSVGQDDGIDAGRIDRERLPIPEPQLLESLKQAAIDEHAPAAHLEQVLGPGHRARGA